MHTKPNHSLDREMDWYEAALEEIGTLIEAEDLDAAGLARLESLGSLVKSFEAVHFAVPPPSPEAAALYEREKRGEIVDWNSLTPAA
jgi:hypothetical protein